MSQAFHQGIFGLDRQHQPDQQQQEAVTNIYVPDGNMWSEMLNLTSSGISVTDLLANQMSAGYRLHRSPATAVAPGFGGDGWYGATAHKDDNSTTLQIASSGGGLCLSPQIDKKQNQHHALPGQLNAGSAAAMQLFLMNHQHQVQQPRSPSAPPPPIPQAIPLHNDFAAPVSSFSGGGGEGGLLGQGLSLSLISPLQQLEIAKAEDVRDGLLHYNNHNIPIQLQGQQQYQPVQVGSMAMMNALRHSKYARAAQELLEEFCNVDRGQTKGSGKRGKARSTSSNPNLSPTRGGEVGWGGASSSSSKEPPPVLSPSDRFEEQRRKARLFSMLEELEKRYNHYREQMQMVVNCFDTVMGFGAAAPYTGLAQKAMSRHFRCLKDAVTAQLKRTCMLLGEKDGGVGSGITKGETPRLKILDQSLRQQRSSSFHQMGIMMDQEPWRPQRGLPERSVNILRAWLFEHFLHPYPSDGDKHLLARQTGLTRNQVSNWFINARVRLWKPMIEEMYLQEAKQVEETEKGGQTSSQPQAQNPETTTAAAETKTSHSITSLSPSISMQEQQQQQRQRQRQRQPFPSAPSSSDTNALNNLGSGGTASGHYRVGGVVGPAAGTNVRFGAASGDVTLTLGLRHAGNMADNSSGGFSLGDFAGR